MRGEWCKQLTINDVRQALQRAQEQFTELSTRPRLRVRFWVPCPRLGVGMFRQHAHAKPWAWHPTTLQPTTATCLVRTEMAADVELRAGPVRLLPDGSGRNP